MKICAAQIRPFKGEIDKNIEQHKRIINLAITNGADLIFFPELSLTGYEPQLAKKMATTQDDLRLDVIQNISDAKNITICVGLPIKNNEDVQIGMVIFQPGRARQTYAKQYLHDDELPYFVKGKHQVILTLDNKKIAPAICYESLLAEHASDVVKSGAEIYLASVAKSATGVAKAFKHYPEVARQYGMPVLMSNSIGPADDFESIGTSSVWNKNGDLVAHLGATDEALLIFDTDTEEILEMINGE